MSRVASLADLLAPQLDAVPGSLPSLAHDRAALGNAEAREEPTAHAPGRFRGVSEFGAVMASFLDVTPGAIACVLSDEEGDSIDFCHDVQEISALDTQIAGAQLGRFAGGLDQMQIAKRCGNPSVLLQCERSNLLLRSMPGSLVLVALLRREANLGRALVHFEELAERLVAMLG